MRRGELKLILSFTYTLCVVDIVFETFSKYISDCFGLNEAFQIDFVCPCFVLFIVLLTKLIFGNWFY